GPGKDDVPRVEGFAKEKQDPVNDARITVVMVPPPRAPPSVAQDAHYFRMRWQSGSRCVARIFLWGKIKEFNGRMPGIFEEAVVALALKQPIYVLGGFHDAARMLGELLGLADTFVRYDENLPPTKDIAAGERYLFKPSGYTNLPVTLDEAMAYLAGHAIG